VPEITPTPSTGRGSKFTAHPDIIRAKRNNTAAWPHEETSGN
jgi:hypothetical protein